MQPPGTSALSGGSGWQPEESGGEACHDQELRIRYIMLLRRCLGSTKRLLSRQRNSGNPPQNSGNATKSNLRNFKVLGHLHDAWRNNRLQVCAISSIGPR